MKSKVAVVTGGSAGIGLETAKLLVGNGFRIVICGRNKSVIDEAVHKIGDMCDGFVCDVSNSDDIRRFVNEVRERFGKIDVLVNNAGVLAFKPLIDQSEREIEDQIRINLEGLIKVTKEFLPLIESTIVNVSSVAGRIGNANITTYCASKFGVIGFTEALARELSGVDVYCVNPGLTATRMTNFSGVDPKKVAEVILNVINSKYDLRSGEDIDVREMI